MANRVGSVAPVRPTPPGELLRAELAARGWTQAELAEIMGRPLAALNQIIGGKKQVTAETAAELGRALGTTAELWLRLEAAYRLGLAEAPAAEPRLAAIADRRAMRERVPCLKELLQRGWVDPDPTAGSLTDRVLRFFAVSSTDQLEAALQATAFRRSAGAATPGVTLAAYVRGVELSVVGQSVAPYSRQQLETGLPQLLELSQTAEATARVPATLGELGVRFAVVPTLTGAKVDGVSLHRADGPIVAVSLRYDRLDSFWFTLLHELAHLLLGHADDQVDEELAPSSEDPLEQAANDLASALLLPPERFEAFAVGLSRGATRRAVLEFARSVGRHPSIVVGRLQWSGVLPYTHLNQLKTKVAATLASAAPG
ncbi:MAG: HigA family addiction module antidote protein [Fimbriimonadaceae bacterium]|nr:HigA family addiction module antidote protein [Fimbriimonadaceae bacterium]